MMMMAMIKIIIEMMLALLSCQIINLPAKVFVPNEKSTEAQNHVMLFYVIMLMFNKIVCRRKKNNGHDGMMHYVRKVSWDLQ
jgi:hypothetical protein